jgi:hypothetical protein|tara:strand:+ start:832 stop:990 length:159 start_codon:yes stop_codon:yes gene_type:complete
MSKLIEIIRLVDELGWEFDRMSSSGQNAMIELQKILGTGIYPINRPTSKENA